MTTQPAFTEGGIGGFGGFGVGFDSPMLTSPLTTDRDGFVGTWQPVITPITPHPENNAGLLERL